MKQAFKIFFEYLIPKNPYVYIDVGALGGLPRQWQPFEGWMDVIAFEPDKRAFQLLKSSQRTKYFNYVLSEKSHDVTFYVSQDQGKSSVFKPNMRLLEHFENAGRFQTVEEIRFPASRVVTLDDVCRENGVIDVDFVKLDTQGSELAILQGSIHRVLPDVFGVHIEVEFLRMYENQPLFHDVDRFMVGQGFELIDLARLYWKRKDFYDYFGRGQLVAGDALYFRKLSSIEDNLKKTVGGRYARNKIYKCVIACMVYNIFDYAVSLTELGIGLQVFSRQEGDELRALIKSCAYVNSLPGFPGRNVLGRIFNRLGEIFRPTSYLGWADRDRTLGNVRDI